MKNSFQSQQAKYANESFKNLKTLDIDSVNTAEEIELATILSQIKNPKKKRVLDIGCGTGRTGLRLSKYVKEVVGLDISRHSIGIANNTAKKYKVKNFKGVVGSIEGIAFKNYFDYVIMVSLIHHVDDLNALFANAAKVLKKDGVIIIVEFNPLNLLFIPFLIYSKAFKSHFNKGYFRSNIFTLKRILKNNNVRSLKITKHGHLPTFLYNVSEEFVEVNKTLNGIPIIGSFSAFHIISFKPEKTS